MNPISLINLNGDPEGIWLARDLIEKDVQAQNLSQRLVMLCGSCGHKASGYNSWGSWRNERMTEFYCPSCWTACFRWSIVLATEGIASEIEIGELHDYIRLKNDMDFWHGDISDERNIDDISSFRGSGGRLVKDRQSALDGVLDWNPICPICTIDYYDAEIDFHHWDYEENVGVNICRDCHMKIHRGKRIRDQVKEPGVDDWRSDSIDTALSLASDDYYSDGVGFGVNEISIRLNIPKRIIDKFMNPQGKKSLAEFID